MKKKVVIALGGNALGSSPKEQEKLIKNTAIHIVDIIENGNEVIITHGNGPQIGMINDSMQYSYEEKKLPFMPFAECGAMSQGYIGYQLQQAITEELKKRSINKNCITIITQVLVDKNDKAFKNPTKPIGLFYTKKDAENLSKEKHYIFKEDAGRGYRRVVASPEPLDILELKAVKDLLKKGYVVITCGGGGIPVIKNKKEYEGIDAVIDKDKSSALLAGKINADVLLILTNVDKVSINYKKENEKKLTNLSIREAKEFIKRGEFAEGSMLPKVQACLNFVTNKKRKAIITSLEEAKNALLGKNGTLIKGGKNV